MISSKHGCTNLSHSVGLNQVQPVIRVSGLLCFDFISFPNVIFRTIMVPDISRFSCCCKMKTALSIGFYRSKSNENVRFGNRGLITEICAPAQLLAGLPKRLFGWHQRLSIGNHILALQLLSFSMKELKLNWETCDLNFLIRKITTAGSDKL